MTAPSQGSPYRTKDFPDDRIMEEGHCAGEGQPFLASSDADVPADGGSGGEPVFAHLNEHQGEFVMKSSMHRQGDILLTAIDQLPAGLTRRPDNVIVRGEATGHAHRLQEGRVWEDAEGHLFLEVLIPTRVVHQEHHPIALVTGYYQVTRQREYVPEAPDPERNLEEEMRRIEEMNRSRFVED
jgi:hypothetical protein